MMRLSVVEYYANELAMSWPYMLTVFMTSHYKCMTKWNLEATSFHFLSLRRQSAFCSVAVIYHLKKTKFTHFFLSKNKLSSKSAARSIYSLSLSFCSQCFVLFEVSNTSCPLPSFCSDPFILFY